MREDPVRALRAVRFAARLGFAIAPDTFEAMRRHAGELARCAPARVLEEIFKLLRCGGSARAFALLRACGALPMILPALAAAHERWNDAQRKGFIAHLGALDRLTRSGEQVSEAVLLGTLLVHLGAPPPSPGGEDDLPDEAAEGEDAPPGLRASPAAELLLEELVRTSRLPRKVAERIRLALHAQSIFFEPHPKARRRRRGRGLAGQPYFTDALQLLRITVEATGVGVDVYHHWKAEAARQPPAPPRPEGRESGRGGGHGGGHGQRGGRGRREGAGRHAGPPGNATHATHDGHAAHEAHDAHDAQDAHDVHGGDGGHGRGSSRGPGRGHGHGHGHGPAANEGKTRSIDMGRGDSGPSEAVPAGGHGAITTVDAGPGDHGGHGEGAEAGTSARRGRGGRRRRRRGGGGGSGGGGPASSGGAPSGSPPPTPAVE
jgi:poly(A) polymerase